MIARHLPKHHWSYPLIALLAGVVMIVRVVVTSHVFNNTVDEPYHIGSAMVLWETKQLIVGAQHPPLARWVIGLPLVMQGVSFPEARGEYVVVEYQGFDLGRHILHSGQLPYWRMLTAARHALLIFSAAALFYVYRLGRYLFGPLVGMLATVFFSFDPTFLAHSGLIGTDIAGCAGFLAGIYYALRFCAKPQAGRAVIFGVALGLALSCKLSCVLLIPSLAMIVFARWILHRKRLPSPAILILACAIATIVLWATYGFAINPMRLQAMFMNPQTFNSLPQVIREQPIPMPSFFLGLLFLSWRASADSTLSYLNGQVSGDGWLGYFPEAIAVKEPLGFLVALLACVVIICIRPRKTRGRLLLIPILLVLAVSMRSRYQLGIRHLLPILPLMYVFVVVQLARANWILPLLGVILLSGIETAMVHPDYLAFFNMAAGGPLRGERYLIDSNLDWGQDLARLARWLKSDEVKGKPYSIHCAYATEPLLRELGLDPAEMKTKPHGLFAISKNVSHRLEFAKVDKGGLHLEEDYSWLSRYPLVKRIGYSIDVYDLSEK